MTNGERIRSMSDEEIADAMKRYACPPDRDWYDCKWGGDCVACRLDWLRQEATNDKSSA